ncbi:MAG: alpha/beta hydrolase [Actinomycetota bacterium]|nr:alpha/beta hydrolase [Actinomycetota bacterium]MDA8208575.1 alpha/beta hydrolase [Actinomycetota bacterium]
MSLVEEADQGDTDPAAPSGVGTWLYCYTDDHWESCSQLSAGDGTDPAILLVHGQPGSGRLWGALPAHLARLGKVYSYDRPGWGAHRTSPGDLRYNARWLCAIADALGGRVVVVGYSYGAAVALEAIAIGCSAIQGLVLVAPAANELAVGPLDRAFEPAWISNSTARAAAWGASGRLPGRLERALLSAHSLAVESGSLRGDLNGLRNSAAASVPVAIVAGLADRTVPPSSVSLLASALGAEEVRWSSTSGHLLPLRRPRLVAESTAWVLRSVRG